MFKRILVPTDGSELSNEAVKDAIKLAQECGAALVILNVQPVYRPPVAAETAMAYGYTQGDYEASAMQNAEQVVSAAAKLAAAASVSCKTIAQLEVSPYEAIIRVAKDEACDLIFMASHGRRGVAALLLGSETHKVLTHCKVPVLVHR
jgi:nucleotide-binding universal stress UspA family protein